MNKQLIKIGALTGAILCSSQLAAEDPNADTVRPGGDALWL